MELNFKIFKICITCIIFTAFICLGFIFCLRLDEPVFLKTYCEYEVQEDVNDENHYEDTQFIIRYITNIDDKAKVTNVTFLEAPELDFWASEDKPNSSFVFSYNNNENNVIGERCGTYSIRTVYVNLLSREDIFNDNSILELNNAEVMFSDGTSMNVQLGRLLFSKKTNSTQLLTNDYSGSTSSEGSHISEEKYIVEKNLKLLSVNSPLFKETNELIELTIDGNKFDKVNNIQYEKFDTIDVKSRFKDKLDTMSYYTMYDIKPVIAYEDDFGNTYELRIYNIERNTYNLECDFIKLIKYLKERGSI
ncbi:hypothetical protein [Anaerovorax odorimutans]|uniref:hypothetical protein n=1 Tax=Anaerovorax odorimutans TaxID=109327 RepID=UPI0003F832F4|nr:hypothetical protein [Anaerovorax odorimutans]